ncbi:MAG TPA: DUF1844 domain-containing protein [Candidatus Saccharicenans sp.]|jgi:ABC-type hemin transport system ATPase subunit|nr:DUF1844 domain-containing protein [Candidatus Saccharicenans sp.]HRD02344.1 DUF1844 domain-containing protein [Candidatus Saccharicenans sp.]
MSDRSNDESRDEEKAEFMPPVDFSSIVFPFYTQALMKLGLLENPQNNQTEENLEYARRLIDLLDLLKDRTKGNLLPEEENFLEAVLSQLKMHYLNKTEAIKL